MASTKRTLEPKPEQADGFRSSYVSSSRTNPKWRVGNNERAPIDRVDASLATDLTGIWVHDGREYHLFINQAGWHIEGVLAVVESGSSGQDKDAPRDKKRTAERLISFGGQFDLDKDRFRLYLHDEGLAIDDTSLECGELVWQAGGNRLAIQFEPDAVAGRYSAEKYKRLEALAKTTAQRQTSDPVLLERQLSQPWVPVDVRTAYWFPLTVIQQHSLAKYIFSARVGVATNFSLDAGGKKIGYVQLVKDYFAVRDNTYWEKPKPLSTRTQWRRYIGVALDKVVWQAYQDAFKTSATKGGIDTFGLFDWRLATLGALYDKLVAAPADEAPERLIDLTQQILDGLSGEYHAAFLERLGLAPIEGGHTYDVHIDLVTLGGDGDEAERKIVKILAKKGIKNAKKVGKKLAKRLPLEVGAGLLEVKNRAMVDGKAVAKDANKYDWEAHYTIKLFGGGIAFDVGGVALVSSDGIAEEVYGTAWEPEHLQGRGYLVDAGVGGHFGPWGKSASGTLLSCRGVGPPKHTSHFPINLSGLGDLVGAWGYGANFRVMVARIAHLASHNRPQDIEGPPDMQEFEYGVHSETGPIHFPINGAMLEHVGCQLLEIFCASELWALSRPDCELRFDGYADQPHSKVKNLILSRNRAVSCYVFMKNILGKRGKHLPELPKLKPEEEEVEGLEELYGTPEEPKVLEIDEGSVRVFGHGEPQDNQGKPAQYDSNMRRVDVTMNGAISLHLRRMEDK